MKKNMPNNTYNRDLLEYRLERDKTELKGTLKFLKNEIENALTALEDPNLFDLNSLGIFQGNAITADMLAAKIKLERQILQEGEK